MPGTWPLRAVIAGWALVVLAPFTAWLGVLPPIGAMYTLLAGVVLALIAAVAGFVTGVRKQAGRGWAAGLAGLIPLAVVLVMVVPNAGAPRINDITTNHRDPPLFHADGGEGYPADFVGPLRTGYPDLRTERMPGPAHRAFDNAIFTARAQSGWRVARMDRNAMTLEVEAKTFLFRFVDDMVIRIRRQPEGADVLVDVRSRSRVGRGDLGANARRIREFLAELRARLARRQEP